MTADRPLLIHIGYHKTGTTFLQRRFFTEPMGFRPLMDHEAVFQHITRPHTLDFSPAHARQEIEERARNATRCRDTTQADVISSEILSGNPFLGARDSAEIARRLYDALPGARILITIREQGAAIASLYMQYLRRAGRMSPAAFFAEKPAIGYDGFDAEHFAYDRLISYYYGLFGRDAVLVLPQEMLAHDPAAFAGRVRAFCGMGAVGPALGMTREAASYPESAAFLLRRINHFRRGAAGPAPVIDAGPLAHGLARITGGGARWLARHGFARNYRPIRHYVKHRFHNRFASSNVRLAALFAQGKEDQAAGAFLAGWQGIAREIAADTRPSAISDTPVETPALAPVATSDSAAPIRDCRLTRADSG